MSKPRKLTRAADAVQRDVAHKAARAMSYDWPVTVTVGGRVERKVRGRITARRIIDPFVAKLEGESNLEIDIAGETIPVARILDIRRQRIAPE